MSLVEFPVWRRRALADRMGLKTGLAMSRTQLHVLRNPERGPVPLPAYCDGCGTVIESGAVLHGTGVYCTVECSLRGSTRPR